MRAKANAGMVQIFATFGLAIVMRGLAQFFFTPTTAASPLLARRQDRLGRRHLPAAAAAVRRAGRDRRVRRLYFFINRTDFGRALEATREDAGAVALVGIDKNRVFALGWGLGARWSGSPAPSWRSSSTSIPTSARPLR
jgi:branched-chain amino acid transport system permease protein